MKLSESQLDAFKEIGSIGAGNVATSISQMIGQKVSVSVPSSRAIPLEDVCDVLGGRGSLVSMNYVQLTGKLKGGFVLILHEKEALRMVSLLTGDQVNEVQTLNELDLSLLEELGNICAGAYLDAFSSLFGVKIMHSAPILVNDMLGAALDGLLINLGHDVSDVLMIESEFIASDDIVRCHLLFLPDPESLTFMTEKSAVRAKGNEGV